ncbi:MAG: hypothetical protein KAQ87_01915 [Candidatus Pacebacteria bacterium]|nr:hypothetical protein [Candidatus Paceibacterota bacterium]
MENIETISIFISTVALLVSVAVAMQGWWRHRNVYAIERKLFFRKNQIDKSNNNNELKKKLSSGHYTILHTGEYGGCIELILGKIKK